MVDTAASMPKPGRQAQLKRWAEADCEDEVIIAEARKRLKLREIERESFNRASEHQDSKDMSDASYYDEGAVSVREEQAGTSASAITGDQPGFEMLLPRFRDACDHMEPQNALDCAFCGEYPPDDPVLTSCLCLYCTECFTEVLAKAGKAGKSLPIACSAYGDDEIVYYMNLTFGQWEALLHVFDHHTEPLESQWKLYLPDDVNLLWQKCESGNRAAHGDGEHSRNSPELGDDAAELSSDNFDGESRSDGYEHDSGSDTESWLGLVSERGCVVDPRHNTSNIVVHHEEASNQLCLDEVTASEIAELKVENPAWEQDNDLSPADGSESPPHIDLTGADDVVTPVPVQDVGNDSSPDPGPLAHKVEDKNDHDHNGDNDEDEDEDGDDEESLCRCARCASVHESPSFFGS